MAIRNFKHKGLNELFNRGRTAKINKRYHRNALFVLDRLNAIADLKDCAGVKDFHSLSGSRSGAYSMHVSGNYVVTFKWDGKDTYDLDFEDYH